jgi:hypothetical protein
MQQDLTVALLVKKFPVIMGSEGSYRVHKVPQLDPNLNQIIPVQIPPPYFFNMYFNVILLATATVVTSALRPYKLGKYMRNRAAELGHVLQAFKVAFSPHVSL